MDSVDELAEKAAADDKILCDFVEKSGGIIISFASKAAKKYITKSDDEWSIALGAFTDAVRSYSKDRGAFLSYAEKTVRNRLIDYYRSERRHRALYSVDPDIFNSESDENDKDSNIRIELSRKLIYQNDDSVKYEIEAISRVFKEYRFTFYDLARCSPKSLKTKAACKKAVLYILENKDLKEEIKNKKTLPVKILEKNTSV